MKNRVIVLLFFICLGHLSHAKSDTLKSLVYETMLHPGDAFTAYVYKQGEWGYNQSITPYPNWAWWGITDWVTAELDLEAWLGGVPSFNFRFGILKQNDWMPAVAFETMFQYINKGSFGSFDQFYNLDYLDIKRHGGSWYNHVNMSWKVREKFHVHVSGGCTIAQSITFDSPSLSEEKSYSSLVSPDYSIGIDWRYKKWGSLHVTHSYGSTFLYADNIPRKRQSTIAGRFAPFIWTNVGFLNSFRIELALINANFPDAQEFIQGPIGFIYWQWDWSKENRQRRKNNKTK